MGIMFSSKDQLNLEAFIKFPTTRSKLISCTDANWGPQDVSVSKTSDKLAFLDFFKSCSLVGYLIWLGGSLHWISKRQTITAHSTVEAEVYATNECTKIILQLRQILQALNLDKYTYMIYNKNL